MKWKPADVAAFVRDDDFSFSGTDRVSRADVERISKKGTFSRDGNSALAESNDRTLEIQQPLVQSGLLALQRVGEISIHLLLRVLKLSWSVGIDRVFQVEIDLPRRHVFARRWDIRWQNHLNHCGCHARAEDHLGNLEKQTAEPHVLLL